MDLLTSAMMTATYRKISNILSNFKCFLSHLVVVFVQPIEARYLVENEDVVGAAPTGVE